MPFGRSSGLIGIKYNDKYGLDDNHQCGDRRNQRGRWHRYFFDRKHKKRAAELANESTVSSQWKELFERSEKKVDAQSDKIEGLYKTIGNMRSQLDGLASQKAVLTLYKCCKVNCPDREPPFGSQEKTHNKNHEQQ